MSFFQRILRRIHLREPSPPREDSKAVVTKIDRASTRWALNGKHAILVGMAQSAGIVRDHNEDSLFIMMGNLIGQDPLTDFGLFVVADGMGGHRAGEVASAISVRTVARHMTEDTIIHLFDNDAIDPLSHIQDLLRDALESANQAVVEKVPGGGTTLTAALLFDKKVAIGHVGDSRAYIITDSTAKVLTRDHSLVERLRELGQLTPDEAASHPQRNVLYRAIGQGANLEVDTLIHPVSDGSHLLLCSDGLWSEVPDIELHRIVTSTPHPQDACDEMVRAANLAGGSDNISAILIRFPGD
jgi:serine/threonine protein phosphatase PrpC